MKPSLVCTAALAILACSASAVTITLDAELLKSADGSAMPTTGLLVLTALTSGSDFGPTPTSFTKSNEFLLAKWDLTAFATPGVFDGILADLAFQGDWNEADPLRAYWYPALTINSTEPGLGTFYGTYTDLVGIDGSAPWLTPSQSSTISLNFYTSDATFLTNGGSNSPQSARAVLQVSAANVPEPVSTFSMTALGLGLVIVGRSCAGVRTGRL